ncbi:MAG: dihydropteroate synthase [Dysgonamonadaceae bacterium]|jgi:dihydropteroate synthase|nr:dihydropteroate synthase [Dysgonamonadaceae bacterium]
MKKYINIKGSLVDFDTPIVMGIVNVTPDSFYAASRKQTEDSLIARCRQIMEEGGAIIDIGAQSSSPESKFLSAEEEAARLMPALAAIRKEFPSAVLSVDTFYAEVAKRAVLDFGADIINDVSGGQIDENMFSTAAELNVPYILMQMRGTPQTMQQHTQYDNFIQDFLYYFSEKINRLNQLGVNDIIIDPGFGFSKTIEQNYELMACLKYLDVFEAPLLVGISRKSMIYKLLKTRPEESLNGTTALNTAALLSGADILRVHDVKEAVECVKIVTEIKKFDKPV